MTDPTPRTAATARDALLTIRASLQREYDGVSGGDRPPYYANGILYALMVIDKYATPEALAAAEAPGRVSALVEEARLVSQWADAVDQMPTELRGELYDLGVHARALAAPASPAGVSGAAIDAAHLARQREWSERTFGPGPRTNGVLDHIRKELAEIEADPYGDEWVDVVILALDGAWRAGHEPQAIIDAIIAKQTKNEGRVWPDWRTMSADRAIEHDRSHDPATQPTPALTAERCHHTDADGDVCGYTHRERDLLAFDHERKALRDALTAYGHHADDCEYALTVCTCGFTEAMRTLFRGGTPMTTPTDPTPAATARDALLFLSTYEKDPPEVMKDDYAYDRLLAFVHDVASSALAATGAPAGVSVEVCGDAPIRCHLPAGHDGDHHDGEGGWTSDGTPITHPAPAPTPSEPVARSGGARHWTLWESEVTDGWTILDPDGFRHGKPTEVTKEEFERARNECTLIRDESRGQYGLPPRPTPATRDE